MEEQIAKKAANVPGHVGVVVKNLKSQKIFMLNERHIFNSASIIKLPILCAAYEASKNGLFKLNDRVEFTKGNVYGGNGLINQFAYGLKPTIRDCMVLTCWAALTISILSVSVMVGKIQKSSVNFLILKRWRRD